MGNEGLRGLFPAAGTPSQINATQHIIYMENVFEEFKWLLQVNRDRVLQMAQETVKQFTSGPLGVVPKIEIHANGIQIIHLRLCCYERVAEHILLWPGDSSSEKEGFLLGQKIMYDKAQLKLLHDFWGLHHYPFPFDSIINFDYIFYPAPDPPCGPDPPLY